MSRRRNGQSILLSASRRAVSSTAATLASLGLLWPTSLATSTFVEAKTPGKTYCYYRTCHRVMTLDETRRAVGRNHVLVASHYDDPWKDRFNPRNLTSSGEMFESGRPDNAASPKLPNGTVLLAWNPATKGAAVLRINNAGPYWGNRTLDVSRGAAERLGFSRQGVATLHTKIIAAPTKEDATYRKGRRYAAVPGFIGLFESIDHALLEAGRSIHRLISPPVHLIAGRDPAPATPVETRPTRPGTLVAEARRKQPRKGVQPTIVASVQPADAPEQEPTAPAAAASQQPPVATPAAPPLVLSAATSAAVASLPPATMLNALVVPVTGGGGFAAASVLRPARVATAKQRSAELTRARAPSPPAQPVKAAPAPSRAAPAAPRTSAPTAIRPVSLQPTAARTVQRRQIDAPAQVDDEDDDDEARSARASRRQQTPTGQQTMRRPITAPVGGYASIECQGFPRASSCDRPRVPAGERTSRGRSLSANRS